MTLFCWFQIHFTTLNNVMHHLIISKFNPRLVVQLDQTSALQDLCLHTSAKKGTCGKYIKKYIHWVVVFRRLRRQHLDIINDLTLLVGYLTPDSDLDLTPDPDQFGPPVRYINLWCCVKIFQGKQRFFTFSLNLSLIALFFSRKF